MNDEIIRTANPRRAIPGEHPEVARLSAMVVALLGELTVVRERLDTLERVAETAGAFDRATVEHYRASGPAVAERDAIRRNLIAAVMQPLRRTAEMSSERYRRRGDAVAADEVLGQE